MQTQLKKLSELKFADYNPRQIKDHDFQALVRSIKEFGFVEPVVVNKDNTIIGGHMRCRAAQELGIVDIPVVYVDLSKEKEKALNLALNRISGDWDDDKLAEILYELETLPEIHLTGFTDSEISKSLDLVRRAKEDEFDAQKEYDSITSSKTKQGDLYILGPHKLICGDATKQEDWEKLMGNERGHLIFTDPPYNVDYHSVGGLTYSSKKYGGTEGVIFNDDKTDAEALEFYTATLQNLYLYTTSDATIYWWFANKNNWLNRQAFHDSDWRMSQIIIWLKNSLVFSQGQDYHRIYEPCMLGWKKGQAHYSNKKYTNLTDVFNLNFNDFEEMLDVWYQTRDQTSKYLHPTQKPVRLAERGLKKNSKTGDIVIDAFGGSGSTLIACDLMHRQARLMELDPKYVDVIVKRWEQLTGETAELVS